MVMTINIIPATANSTYIIVRTQLQMVHGDSDVRHEVSNANSATNAIDNIEPMMFHIPNILLMIARMIDKTINI